MQSVPGHSVLAPYLTTVYMKFAGHAVQVRRRAHVKFNQMSGKEVKMSGEAQKNFVYTAYQVPLKTLFIKYQFSE